MDLRCDSRILHGILDDDCIEVKCRSKRCGHETGVVVIHRFNVNTGELELTRRFRETPEHKENDHVHGREPAALWPA